MCNLVTMSISMYVVLWWLRLILWSRIIVLLNQKALGTHDNKDPENVHRWQSRAGFCWCCCACCAIYAVRPCCRDWLAATLRSGFYVDILWYIVHTPPFRCLVLVHTCVHITIPQATINWPTSQSVHTPIWYRNDTPIAQLLPLSQNVSIKCAKVFL